MYLKSLEVQGFKAFAHKINFEFHNGITGIVGPNGSGKSNVADAVRWVLGEQRAKQLRGSNMQDVIFAGTESRKPLSSASVSITLDNSDHQLAIDFSEVTVTRRVFRSGESEYLINGTPCRLKDVNELFYDTGIGKDGYSIIGQGQIDRILSGRPEERRELFDEAAGIVKFKRRKAEAQRKLENERANLVRVNDILGEIEKQLGPLERQSDVAKTFLRKRSQLETYEVNMFLMEVERINEQLSSIEEKAKITQDELNDTNAQVNAIKAEYERMEKELEEVDARIDSTREELSNTNLIKGNLQGQINVLEAEIKAAENSDEQFKSRVDGIDANIAEKMGQKDGYDKQQSELQTLVNGTTEKLTVAREELQRIQAEIARCNTGIENGKNEIIELLNAKAVIKAKQQKFDTMLEQVNIRKAQLNQRLLQKKSDEAEMLQDLKQFEDEYQLVTENIRKKSEEINTLEGKKQQWIAKRVETGKKLEEISIRYHKEQSRLESLKNLAERYDGYGNSIKKVMERKDTDKGIVGVISDIISVDKKYEIAIETALGGNIQNIVTKDEDAAKRQVAFLKENKLGRATFLPLTSVKGWEDEKTQKALDEKGMGVIGRADDLVKTDSMFKDIMEYLLCRVIVVDTIENGLKLAKKYQYALRIVTLEGEHLNTGGSITGGAYKNNSNLLGRTREIEEIEASIKHLEEEQKQLKARLEEISVAEDFAASDIQTAKEALGKLQIDANTAEMKVEAARKQKEESDRLYDGLQMETVEIEGELSEITLGKNKALEDLNQSDLRTKEIEELNKKLQETLEQSIYLEEEQAKLVSALQMEEAGVAQRNDFVLENIRRVAEELRRLEEEKQQVLTAAGVSKEEIETKKGQIEEIKKTIAAGDDTYAKLDELLAELHKQKDAMNLSHKGFFEKREELTGKQSDLDKELFRLNAQREKLNETMEAQNNHMWEEYELTLHSAMKLRDPEYNNAAEMKRNIATLKDEIKKLGDVNVGAIEEFKNLSERYEFMSGQRDDLVLAEANLVDVIADLDAGMRKQFMEKFAEIQKEFDKAFKELFGGGKGTLELQTDEDILECGIIITAQPPGKKLQNMMQLSGGEKALTAIALLFAIQNLKPSPFCLLDEIEAALDDSNVGRFAKYLHKLTKNTQFIIITHRRGTMAAADRLYGITMQEKGVSALVSVNLIENELDE